MTAHTEADLNEDHILHLTTAAEWHDAQATGSYRRSTRGRSLDEVGFIHCSRPNQLDDVAALVYAGCDDELVVLVMRLSALEESGLVVRFEDGGNGQHYPHIYGPLPCDLVDEVVPR